MFCVPACPNARRSLISVVRALPSAAEEQMSLLLRGQIEKVAQHIRRVQIPMSVSVPPIRPVEQVTGRHGLRQEKYKRTIPGPSGCAHSVNVRRISRTTHSRLVIE